MLDMVGNYSDQNNILALFKPTTLLRWSFTEDRSLQRYLVDRPIYYLPMGRVVNRVCFGGEGVGVGLGVKGGAQIKAVREMP